MPRKKIAKGSAKRQTKNSFADFTKMEKDFLNTPAKLSKQIDAEIKALKQNAKKIKAALNKNQSSTKAYEKRAKSASNKQQMKSAEKLRVNLMKDANALNKELNQNSTTLDNFTQAQSKLAAVQKHLSAFEKDWTSQSKRASKPTASEKSSKKPTPKTEETPRYQQPYAVSETESADAEASEETMA